jgi:serine protease Do/serine protease DegQ
VLLAGTALAVEAALPVAVDGQPLPSLAPMLERTGPAVVNISTQGSVTAQQQHPLLRDPFFRRFFGFPEEQREQRTQSLGSGVVVDAENGYIITSQHVIEGAQQITVTLANGVTLEAELVGADPNADVAVIRVRSEDLVAVPIADSDGLRVGDFVVAIGNPFGLGQTVTSGIVSALGRSGLGVGDYEYFIQTDASINPGNSGGALVNLRGELVGINTAILSRSGGNIGIGFAIPSNTARDIMDQLVSFGEVKRGLLGIATQDLTPELAEVFKIRRAKGAVIVSISDGSPADRAGLKPGDVVTSINGQDIDGAADLRNTLGSMRAGAALMLELVRDGRRKEVRTALAEVTQARVSGEDMSPRLAGAVLGDIAPGSPLYGKIEGVLVLDVERNTVAARNGLRKGDVIIGANRLRVASLRELGHALARNPRRLSLNLRRGNASLLVFIQ